MEYASENITINDGKKTYMVVRFSHLGDVLLTTGVIARWHEKLNHTAAATNTKGQRHDFETNSHTKFSVLTSKDFAPVFENNPHIDNIHALDLKSLPFSNLKLSFKDIAQQYKNAVLVDLHANLRSRILKLFWQGPALSYNKLGIERRMFLASKGKFFKTRLLEKNVAQRYELTLPLGESPLELLRPKIWLTDDEENFGKSIVQNLFNGGERPVAIHPYAAHSNKTWSRERWINLLEQFDKKGINWLVIGRGEPLVNDPRDLVNKCSLRQSAAILQDCCCLVTGDSGPMHLAAAVDTPVVAIFGPTTKEWGFYPFGTKDIVLEVDLPCRPCSLHGKAECKINGSCLEKITTEQILAAVKKLL